MTEKQWIWVETTTGLSCIDAMSVIGVSHSEHLYHLDFHMVSGTIFTVELCHTTPLLFAMGVESEI